MPTGETQNLSLISDYKNIDKNRLSFNKLAGEVFGIDFEPWYKSGFWNERYVCYSYVADGAVVSNVSVNKMDLIINGVAKNALQIGTVMTHPQYRKRGLSASLMNIAPGEYASKCDFIYLFAGESAYDFYPKFGFEEIRETSFAFEPELRGVKGPAMRSLDIGGEKDFEILKRLSYNRTPVSKKFGVINCSHLTMFYCLLYYGKDIYYIDDIDTAVIYRIKDGSLYLYDILSESDADTGAVLNALAKNMRAAGAGKIVFMFTPDRFELDIKGYKEEKEYKLFVKPGSGEIPDGFTVPRLSHA